MSRNVCLVCLDSVRKDYFDEYAPRLREMADISFEQCRAASSWSVPSHASMITGLLPHQHGLHAYNYDFSTLPVEQTVFADIPEYYHTAGISANVYAGPAYGFDRYFDSFVDAPRYQLFADGMNATTFFNETDERGMKLYFEYLREAVGHERPLRSLANGVAAQTKRSAMGSPIPDPMDDGAKLIRREARKIIKETDAPTVLFLNFMEAHASYSPMVGMDSSLHTVQNSWTSTSEDFWDVATAPEEYPAYLNALRELYAANIDYLDRIVAGLLADLEEITDRETTAIITADHGENLGYQYEDGLLGHKSSLSESLLHVPLTMVNPPDGSERRITRFCSHLSLPDLIRGCINDELPDIGADRVVAEHIGMSPGPEPPDNKAFWDRMMRCAYEGNEKTVWDSLGERTVYNLDSQRPCWQSPSEDTEREVVVPQWATDWFDVEIDDYKENVQEPPTSVDIDRATEQRLADLGYL